MTPRNLRLASRSLAPPVRVLRGPTQDYFRLAQFIRIDSSGLAFQTSRLLTP